MHVDLDHVALATRDASPAIHTLVTELSGTVLFGGHGVGFRPMQILLGDAEQGMRVELLEPWLTGENDFLDRFLTQHGQGPHHLTFKVDSLDDALDRVRSAGLTPVNVDRSDDEWQEAFLLPREANGTVVQLAQAVDIFPSRADLLDHVRRHGPHTHPQWWIDPPAPTGVRAILDRVVIVSPSPDLACRLFADILQGNVEHEDRGVVDLVWPSGARLRIVTDTTMPPGVDHLAGRINAPARELDIAGTRVVLEPC